MRSFGQYDRRAPNRTRRRPGTTRELCVESLERRELLSGCTRPAALLARTDCNPIPNDHLIAGEERQHFPNRYVRMQAGDLELYFDTQFGGVPLTWARGGRSIIENWGGSGFATSWDTGQDPTPASANGPLPNPIARLGDPSTSGFNYYGRETVSDIVDGRPVYHRVRADVLVVV